MSLPRSDSAETCTSGEYEDFYHNEKLRTDLLSDDVLRNVIRPNSASYAQPTPDIASTTFYRPCWSTRHTHWDDDTSRFLFTLHIKMAKTK
jgi:hypothetical protein